MFCDYSLNICDYVLNILRVLKLCDVISQVGFGIEISHVWKWDFCVFLWWVCNRELGKEDF